MAGRIERAEVARLMNQGGQLVEVLPEQEYQQEHIAGAVNIPLRRLDTEAPQRLHKGSPVVVYCNDFL